MSETKQVLEELKKKIEGKIIVGRAMENISKNDTGYVDCVLTEKDIAHNDALFFALTLINEQLEK